MKKSQTINGETRITGLFGFPVKHSLSPAMHNAAFHHLGLNYVYVPFEVTPENIPAAVASLRSLSLSGVNVTVPHKETVIPHLDRIDPFARAVGSVNTIVNKNGKLTGYNTDAPGFVKDLKSHGFNPEGKTVILLGAGGAGKAVAAALSKAKARRIYIANNIEKQSSVLAHRTPRAVYLPLAVWKHKLAEADLLVNTTPVGMHAGDAPLATAAELKRSLFVYDVIYNRETELIKAAKKAGCRCADGLGMLLHQGALAFELWTGKPAPVEVMRKALTAFTKK